MTRYFRQLGAIGLLAQRSLASPADASKGVDTTLTNAAAPQARRQMTASA